MGRRTAFTGGEIIGTWLVVADDGTRSPDGRHVLYLCRCTSCGAEYRREPQGISARAGCGACALRRRAEKTAKQERAASLAAEGLTQRQIAERMSISQQAVCRLLGRRERKKKEGS